MNEPNASLTRLLAESDFRDQESRERLLSLTYEELRQMAQSRMASERSNHTLQPTALIHEAYLRLAGTPARFDNRAHFFGAAAEAMRRILIDQARQRLAQKRGGGAVPITMSQLVEESPEPDFELDILDEAIEKLTLEDERLAQVVKLRFFVCLSVEETADVLGVSAATVKRDWKYARAWLVTYMKTERDA